MVELHPIAIHHLSPFATAPGETDVLCVVVAVVVLLMVTVLGVFMILCIQGLLLPFETLVLRGR